MFESGTKIITVESSLHKTVGPRKGSIGYVSNHYDTMVFNLMTNEFNSFDIVSSLCEVFFIRFGFEKHGRLERKTVISVFPILKKETKDRSPEAKKCVRDLSDIINSQKNNYLWENVRSNYNDVTSSVPIVLATPLSYDPTDLRKCTEPEFKGWINSYLTSYPLIRFVAKTMESGHFTKYNDEEFSSAKTWENIALITSDRAYRKECIRDWAHSIETRKIGIDFIRKLIAIQSRHHMDSLIKLINNTMFLGTHNILGVIYNLAGPHIYNKFFISRLEDVVRKLEISDAKAAIADIKAVTSECLSLSDDMLRSNNGSGYTPFSK